MPGAFVDLLQTKNIITTTLLEERCRFIEEDRISNTMRQPGDDQHASHVHLLSTPELKLPDYELRTRPLISIPSASSNKSQRKEEAGQRTETATRGLPKSPQRLSEWSPLKIFMFICDIILTLAPLIFIVLGACALSLDKKPTSKYGSRIREAANVGPSLFPIVFAAVVSRLMRAAALWRAECGTKLGVLEQLIGSHNLAGAVQRVFLLRRYTLLGLAIVALWLLSPLGGQSSLRILDLAQSTVISSQVVSYFNTNITGKGAGFDYSAGPASPYYGGPTFSALLQASLLAPQSVRTSPVDVWNNVKIPMLDEMSPYHDRLPGNPWIPIENPQNVTWSSLSGLNLAGLSTNGSTDFTIESSYLDLACSDVVLYNGTNSTSQNGEYNYTYALDGRILFHNTTFPFVGPTDYDATAQSSSFMDTNTINNGPDHYSGQPPLNLVYGYTQDLGANMDLFNCTILTARVESGITCLGKACAVKRMRRSTTDTRPPTTMQLRVTEYKNMLNFMAFATGAQRLNGEAAPTDAYVFGNASPYQLAAIYMPNGATIAKRLATLLNTVWQASLTDTAIALGPTADARDFTNGNLGYPGKAKTTTATVTNDGVPIYTASRLWITLLLVTSTILMLCAVAGLALKYTTTAPDILGYVSTMTRDNPNTTVSDDGNTLDGLDRARHLRNLQVQIADVRWSETEGHIAFRTVESGDDFKLGRVSRDRLYS